MKKFKKSGLLKKLLKWGGIIVLIAIILNLAFRHFAGKNSSAETVQIQTTKVAARDIENVLSSSGSIEPLASYQVTTLVEGEIIEADFEVGDEVEEGQVLYKIATDTLDSKIDNAETALTRAKKNYTKAEENYQNAQENLKEAKDDYKVAVSKYDTIHLTSSESGIIKSILVEAGDTIQKGSQIAEIYDNSTMLLTIPFSSSEVDSSYIGKTADITINNSFETIKGKVTEVSSIEETLSGNRLVKKVTIEAENPGAITTTTTAEASIGSVYSMDTGTFSVKTNTIITSDLEGEVAYISVNEGDSVREGSLILTISQESVDDKLETYQKVVDNAQDAVETAQDMLEEKKEAIEDAESNLDDVIDNRTDYSITAPVSGKIISKNMLKGDIIGTNNFNSTLCVIYDLSAVTFQMYVDELDVMKVEEGQEVNITADALSGEEIQGLVTNVSLESVSSQGVTQYPVTVRIDQVGSLLPGMNVTGEIVVAKAEGVLAIPSQSLKRGKGGKDVVYMKDDSVIEEEGDIPAGYKSVEVTTGLTDGSYVEIQSGLTEGEEIYLTEVQTDNSSGLDGFLSTFNMNTSTSQEQTQQRRSSDNFQGGGFQEGGYQGSRRGR